MKNTGKLTVNHVRTGGLTINAGTVAIKPDGTSAGASRIDNLIIAAGAKLDLTDNKLIVSNAALGSATGGDVQRRPRPGAVRARAGGDVGRRRDHHVRPADRQRQFEMGIGVASIAQIREIGPADTDTFAGQTITGATSLAMYTYVGDANLDGNVTGDDYAGIDFNVGSGADGWFNGDFNSTAR